MTAVVASGIVALVALAVTVGALVWLHVVATGLSPRRDAVSRYGISTRRGGYRVATLAFGVAGAALAVGLGSAHLRAPVGGVTAALCVFGLGRGVISWLPMDAPGAERTSTGSAHGLVALTTFVAATYAALHLGSALSAGGRFASLARVSTGFGWAMFAALGGLLLARVSPGFRERFGLVERALYLVMLGWTATFAVACAISLS